MWKLISLSIILIFSTSARASEYIQHKNWYIPEKIYWGIPRSVISYMDNSQNKEQYIIYENVNPFYLRLDIYGDGEYGHAVLIQGLKNKKLGILLCKNNSQCRVLFAGNGVNNIGSTELSYDINWLQYWEIDDTKEKIGKFPELPLPPQKIGEGIIIGMIESAARMLYWDGTKFVTYQLSD